MIGFIKCIVRFVFKNFHFGEPKSHPLKLNTKLTLLIFTLNGHNDLLKTNSFYVIYKFVFRFLYWSMIVLNGINLYVLRSDFIYIFSYFLILISFVLMVVKLRCNQDCLNLLMDTNRSFEATQSLAGYTKRQKAELAQTQRLTENVLVFYLMLGVMGCITNTSTPFVYLFLNKRPTSQLIGEVYTLIYPAYWPLNLHQYENYIPYMFYQICCGFMYPIMFFNTIPFLNFCLELKRQCKILCFNVENNIIGKDGRYRKAHFVQCVRHHCVLTESVLYSINKAYGSIVSNVLLFSVIFNCISAYTILVSTQHSFATAIKFLVLSLVFLFQLFVYCVIGSDIADLNDKVRNAIFNIRWYTRSVDMKHRRDLITWMTHCHRPVRLLYAHSYVVSLSTFVLSTCMTRLTRDLITWMTHCHRPVRLLYADSYVVSLSTFVLVSPHVPMTPDTRPHHLDDTLSSSCETPVCSLLCRVIVHVCAGKFTCMLTLNTQLTCGTQTRPKHIWRDGF
ncbi:hypothetical protein M8J77_009043 [Diaphorina citri]|nr:hypothetical protein M8J77_009043 [Diaphorina citri]